MTLGAPRVHRRVTGSTNDDARALALAGAPHGTLVTADRQTEGRGRRGRSWDAGPGDALLMSVVLREIPGLLPLRAAIAVRRVCGAEAALKWPNDVLVGELKVAGILCERRAGEDHAIAGIGINVAAAPDVPGAGSLGLRPGDREPLLRSLLDELGIALAAPSGDVVRELASHDALAGRAITWDGGRGVADGIDAEGHLRVTTAAGTISLAAGEVGLVRAD